MLLRALRLIVVIRCMVVCSLLLGAAQAQKVPVKGGKTPFELYHLASNGNLAALAQLKKLATDGDAESQFNLGGMYANGDGVPKDAAQAVGWFRKAAEQGNAFAQNGLGVMYAKGDGVPKDAAQAVGWYRKAAEQGHASAQSSLGARYYNGDGVPKDAVTSYMWRNLAAAQGDQIAKTARDALESLMTPAQIAEAQMRSREWKPKK